MTLSGCLIIQRDNDWLVAAGNEQQTIASQAAVDEVARLASELVRAAKLKNASCVVAPSSVSSFFAKIDMPSDIDLRDNTSLTFELEDHLPIDAESLVADFMPIDGAASVEQVAAVAVEIEPWKSLIHALESKDLPVRSVVPSAVLAARGLLESGETSEELVLVDGDQCDWMTARATGVTLWKRLQIDDTVLQRHQVMSEMKSSCVVVGANPDQQAVFMNAVPDVEWGDSSRDQLTIDGAELVLSDRWNRWFDLRRGSLAPGDPLRAVAKQLRYVALACAACLLALTIGGWWRTSRINQEIEQIRTQQSVAFKTSYPKSRVPVDLLTRVRSEHKKVLGSRGKSTVVDVPQSAPDVLRALLMGLPQDVRLSITKVDIINGAVNLTIQSRDSVDIGKIATAIKAGGFDVSPPDARQVDPKTYESMLKAVWVPHAPGVQANRPPPTGQPTGAS